MAEKFDGSIKIDTAMQTEGIEKGIEEVDSLLEGLMKKVLTINQRLREIFSFREPIKPIEFEEPEPPKRPEPPKEPEPQKQPEPPKQTPPQVVNIEAAREESKVFQEATRSAMALNTEVNKLNRATEQGFRNPEQVLRFGDNMDAVEQKIADARALLEDIGTVQIPTEEFAEWQRNADNAFDSIDALSAKLREMREAGVDKESAQWQEVTAQLAEAQRHGAELLAQKKEMEAAGALFIDPSDTAQYQELAGAIEAAESHLETSRGLIDQETIAQARLNVLTAQEAVAAARTTSERERAMANLQQAQNELAAVANKSVTPKPDPEAVGGWDGFIAKVRQAERAVSSAFGAGAHKLFNGFKSAIKSVGQGFKNILSHARRATVGTDGLVKSLMSMKTMLIGKIKSTFVNAITNAVTDGLKALVQYNSGVDRAISNLRNRTKEIGANISVTLGNIITAIEPIVTRALDMISAAVTKVNALFAMLRGQSTMVVAKKQAESYASTLDGSADKAKKAAAAQKKLNQQLMGFDQLNKLSAPTENTDQGSTGADMFETVPVNSILKDIPDSLKDTIKEIKDAVKSGNWFGAGAALGKGLNGIIRTLDGFINRARPKALAIAGSIADGLNGLVDSVDFAGIGATLANGFNLIITTADTFVTRVQWGALGGQLIEGLNGLVRSVNWADLGAAMAHGINAVTDFLYAAIVGANWKAYGKAVADALDSAIKKTNWHKAGATLGEAVKGILRSIVTLIEEIDWWAVGTAIADFFAGIDWGGIVALLFEGLGAAIAGALSLLGGIARTLVESLWEALENEFSYFDTGNIGLDIVLGLLKGILDGLAGIGQWIIDNIFKPIWNGIKKAFGIASPSKETEKLGGYIIEGLLKGIVSGLGAILDFFGNLVGKIGEILSGAWQGIKNAATAAWNGIGNFLSNTWTGIKNTASTVWTGVKNTVTGAVTNIKEGIQNSSLYQAGAKLMGTLKDGVSNAWEGVKSTLGGLWDGLGSWLTNTRKGLMEAGSNLVQGLKNGITTGWETVKGAVGTVWDKVTGAAKSAFGINSPSKVFAEIGGYLDEGLVQGIKDEQRTVLDTTAQLARETTERMQAGLKAPTLEAPQIKTLDVPDIHAEVVPEMQTDGIETAADSIQARLHGMAGAFDGLVDRLAAIAEAFAGVQLAIPEIATGAVIPPRLRTTEPQNAQPAAIAAEGQLERKLDTLIALLTDQQAKGRDISITVPLQLDRNELGRAVARYNTSGQRITNGGLR